MIEVDLAELLVEAAPMLVSSTISELDPSPLFVLPLIVTPPRMAFVFEIWYLAANVAPWNEVSVKLLEFRIGEPRNLP